jgi:hypothetical protein
MRRAAPEYHWRLQSSGDSEVRSRPGPPSPELQVCSAAKPSCDTAPDGLTICRDVEFGAADADGRFGAKLEFWSDQRYFERGRIARIADEQVRQPMRERIHGPGYRYPDGLMPPSPEVLHGGLQTWAYNVN